LENYGICPLSLVPIRKEPADKAEMISQLLFGETFEILELKKNWVSIKTSFDGVQGWIQTGQFADIENIDASATPVLSTDLVDVITDANGHLKTIVLGSELTHIQKIAHQFEGRAVSGKKSKKELINFALMYLNSPGLNGGKSPFGIDASGFTQCVYRLTGNALPRLLEQQALEGETLSFIEEAEPGDLVFFDNHHGEIVHTGILLTDNHIIHASEKVRIDRLDQHGIYNAETNQHSHQLRMLKKII
jgi:cell wall-associated NlpC family hydrolase